MSLDIDFKFKQKQLYGNRLTLSNLYYNDRNSGDTFEVEFKSRQWSKNHINMKKIMENVRILDEYICSYTSFQ